ncbi:hypothetical protein EV363DRAFT_1231880 [Boletus edulis]|nr:hypothetical protein EV363DRAFT_1231880 [Boletus edulis]
MFSLGHVSLEVVLVSLLTVVLLVLRFRMAFGAGIGLPISRAIGLVASGAKVERRKLVSMLEDYKSGCASVQLLDVNVWAPERSDADLVVVSERGDKANTPPKNTTLSPFRTNHEGTPPRFYAELVTSPEFRECRHDCPGNGI